MANTLLAASKKGDAAAMQAALAGGSDVNGVDTSGQTAMHIAAASGHVDAVKLLLERDADVDAETKGGDTAL